jgi:hypothetical protein
MAEICRKCGVIEGKFFDKESQKTEKKAVNRRKAHGWGAHGHTPAGVWPYIWGLLVAKEQVGWGWG